MKVRLLCCLLLTGWLGVTSAQTRQMVEQPEGIVFLDNESWENVLQKAKEQDRLIFMDCYAVWCGPCKMLSEFEFPKKEMGDFFNSHFVNVKYDMEKGEGKVIHEKYKEYIPGFPTMLLIDQNGNVVHRMVGHHKAASIVAVMKAGMEGRTLEALEKKYQAGARDYETVRDYTNALRGVLQDQKVQDVKLEYVKTLPVDSLLNKRIWELVGVYVRTIPYSPAYRFVFDHIEDFQSRLNVDRYWLEHQWEIGMSYAVDELIWSTKKTTNADTLKMLEKNADTLRSMLEKNVLKNSPRMLCKLELNDLRLQGKADEMYRMMSCVKRLNLLSDELSFCRDCYEYIVRNMKDKKTLPAVLADLLALQEAEDQKHPRMRENFYQVIAELYSRLRQKDKAAEAQTNYDKLVQIRLAK